MNLLSSSQSFALLAAFLLLAGGVWAFQNSGSKRLGGRISKIKAAWFSYAVVLWIVVPWMLADQGKAFAVLAGSMTIRAAIEIPLCAAGKWRVVYGVCHDVFHAVLVVAVWIVFPMRGLTVWMGLSIAALLTELLFVYWFVRSTDGPGKGVFFVPDGEAHRAINRRTAIVCIPQFAAFVGVLFLP